MILQGCRSFRTIAHECEGTPRAFAEAVAADGIAPAPTRSVAVNGGGPG